MQRSALSSLYPRHPLLMAKLGLNSLPSARTLSRRFRSERTRALFAGIAAHSFLSLEQPASSAAAVLLGAALHAVGWPIPQGGAQSITDALCRCLSEFEITVTTSTRIENLSALPNYDLTLCDVTPRQLLQLAGNRLSESDRKNLKRYRHGPGVFKVDYALRDPIPWTAPECRQAATVHLGGTFDEIAASEATVCSGQHAERPFVLLSQPTLFDLTRAPENRHIAWAYCHVPNGSTFDMLSRLEDQIERYAPGFRDCILKRRVFSPADLEAMDANLIGGDVSGGSLDFRQMLIRPDVAQLCDLGKRHFHLLILNASGRRRAWDVWLPRCETSDLHARVANKCNTARKSLTCAVEQTIALEKLTSKLRLISKEQRRDERSPRSDT